MSTASNPSAGKYTRLFAAAIVGYWLAGIFLLVMYSKADGFEWMRSARNAYADFFFRYITHVGDGLFAIALCLLWVFRKNWEAVWTLLVGYALSGLVAQVMKHIFERPRPAPFFKALGKEIPAIDDVKLLQSYTSFPSGHSATVFAIATALVLTSSWWQKKWWLAVLLAAIVAYSRTYLGQHFLEDTLVGSVLGVLATMAAWIVLKRWKPRFARD
ncbi:MAG TPA: phosphatase PAP2 family protein [Phnomibacter sp.]|nr:phosphatase PAP2 family protein [Phnomibacter sp.]